MSCYSFKDTVANNLFACKSYVGIFTYKQDLALKNHMSLYTMKHNQTKADKTRLFALHIPLIHLKRV